LKRTDERGDPSVLFLLLNSALSGAAPVFGPCCVSGIGDTEILHAAQNDISGKVNGWQVQD
jgi:hypothetical protein